MSVNFFEDTHAIESLRDSYFGELKAYAQVIDNALQANAKKIKIQFDVCKGKRGYQRIERICFADNGDGMNEAILHYCLKLGFSTNFDNCEGIGRLVSG